MAPGKVCELHVGYAGVVRDEGRDCREGFAQDQNGCRLSGGICHLGWSLDTCTLNLYLSLGDEGRWGLDFIELTARPEATDCSRCYKSNPSRLQILSS